MASGGFVFAKVSWSKLSAALEARGAAIELTDIDPENTDALGLTECGGVVLLEGIAVWYTFHSDLIVNLSAELSTLVLMANYETISGTCTLVAAQSGELVRHYHGDSGHKRPLDRGRALPSERGAPLSSHHGLMQALRALGFDLDGPLAQPAARFVLFPGDCPWDAESSPLGLRGIEQEHEAKYGTPNEQWSKALKPKLVMTDLGDGSLGISIRMVRLTWYARLWSWLMGLFRRDARTRPEARGG
jgi:hypothetical protein